MRLDDITTNNHGTHRPVLIECVKNTDGNILELGCGDSSTTIIKELLKNTNRKLVSIESNFEWYNKFKHLKDENHEILFVDAGNEDTAKTGEIWVEFIRNNELLKNMTFDVVFIDQSPWTARTHTLSYFKDICKFVVVHDVDYFPGNNKWGKVINRIPTKPIIFKYNFDFSDILKHYKVYYPPDECFAGQTGPPTLLGSNTTTIEGFENMSKNINYDTYYKPM
jgi:hypothetical protein